MRAVTEQEFIAIRQALSIPTPVDVLARTMQRSEAVIRRVAGSSDYISYKALVRSEHRAKRPRKPLSQRIHEARIEELVEARSRGRLGAYKYIIQRLEELYL